MTLEKIDVLLSTTLNFDVFKNIDTINGIQVANTAPLKKNITRIAVAVDASIPVIRAAAAHKVNLLVVHHGVFWGHSQPITQAMHAKIHALITNDIALYAAHLPLDAHMKLGNNAQIARKLGLKNCVPCAMHKGVCIGMCGSLSSAQTPDAIMKKLFAYPPVTLKQKGCSMLQHYSDCLPYAGTYGLVAHAVENNANEGETPTVPRPLSLALHGRRSVRKVAVISGSGHAFLEEVHKQGADMLITGDASHIACLRAEELGIHLISAGHYFSEIWGPLALGRYLQKEYARDKSTKPPHVLFLDKPTGH